MRNRLQKSLAGGPVEKADCRVVSAQKTWKAWIVCFRTHRRGAAAGVAFVDTPFHSAAVTCCFLSNEGSTGTDTVCCLQRLGSV